RDPQGVMAVLSADHRIERADLFCDILKAAEQLALEGRLVTLGITPTEPSTGYGYIKRGEQIGTYGPHSAHRVAAFVEKPDAERARAYLDSGDYFWNAGMFIWRVDRILEELQRHRPGVAKPLE